MTLLDRSPQPAADRALDAAAPERQRTATWRHLEHVNALLDRREELRGVVPLADVLHEGSTSAA